MSFKTWIKKYYPVPAHKVSKQDAVAHSLQKWIGLLPSNLAKHGLQTDGNAVWPKGEDAWRCNDILCIDCSTCALCKHYISGDTQCRNCPLAMLHDNLPCDVTSDQESDSGGYAPFTEFQSGCDPKPMLKLLRAALKGQQADDAIKVAAKATKAVKKVKKAKASAK